MEVASNRVGASNISCCIRLILAAASDLFAVLSDAYQHITVLSLARTHTYRTTDIRTKRTCVVPYEAYYDPRIKCPLRWMFRELKQGGYKYLKKEGKKFLFLKSFGNDSMRSLMPWCSNKCSKLRRLEELCDRRGARYGVCRSGGRGGVAH